MNVDIRKYIINNFEGSSIEDIRDSIISSIDSGDEVVLPGLGVLFEILWKNCSDKDKSMILNTLKESL